MDYLNRRLAPFSGRPADDESAAVLVDPQVGHIVVGRGLVTGYAGTDGIRCQPFAGESVVLKIKEPGAVRIL